MALTRERATGTGRPRIAIATLLATVLLALIAPTAQGATVRDARGATPNGGSTIQPGSVNRTSINLSATYDVRLTLRYGYGSVSVWSTMTVTNTSGGPIDRLELNVLPARIGRMRLESVRVEGRAVTATRSEQTLTVPLGGILPEGESAVVRIYYTAWFQTSTTGSNWLFSKANGVLSAYRWIPWVSRKVDFDRPNFGDPFVTPVSPRVKVTITTDRAMRIATSGRRTAVSGLTQTFLAERVRDFNLTASPSYQTISGTVGDTKVTVYYRSGSASTMLTWAKRSISRLESLVGPYPYPQFTVAQSGGGVGMESPGLIWIPMGTASSSLPYLVGHETAHQWFYSTVGNDQPTQPWADEAATDFVTRYILGNRRSSSCATGRLDLTIYQYSRSCYYEVVYIQGGNFLDSIRTRMGNTAFWAGMRDYYATYSFRFGGTKQLLDTLDRHTSLNLVPSYEPRFPRYY